MAGAVAVPVNARYQASELGFLVRDADLVLMVTTGRVADSLDFGERLVAALPSLRHADDPRNLSLDEAAKLRSIICLDQPCPRSEEHTSELQSLMRISYAVFCLTKKKNKIIT